MAEIASIKDHRPLNKRKRVTGTSAPVISMPYDWKGQRRLFALHASAVCRIACQMLDHALIDAYLAAYEAMFFRVAKVLVKDVSDLPPTSKQRYFFRLRDILSPYGVRL